MTAPEIVQELAASVSGVPMKWREEEGYWVIIMTDGRKYRFPKEGPAKPRHDETVEDHKPGTLETSQPVRTKKKRAD